jgi:hypothetical protein
MKCPHCNGTGELNAPHYGDLVHAQRRAQNLTQQSGDLRERIARAAYEGRQKGLSNCWKWDDSELDHEHPGTRELYYGMADAILAALQQQKVWK